MPRGQPPTPPDFQQGPFDDAVMMGGLQDGQWSDEEYGRGRDSSDDIMFVEDNKSKKNKNSNGTNKKANKSNINNFDNSYGNGNSNYNDYIYNSKDDKKPVQVRHVGYLLERDRSKTVKVKDRGKTVETASWTSVQPLLYDEQHLAKIANDHLQKSKIPMHEQFKALARNQKAAVIDIVNNEQSREKNKNAEWKLYDIEVNYYAPELRLFSHSRGPKVKSIQVIIKRHDVTLNKDKLYGTVKTTKAGKEGTRDGKQQVLDIDWMDAFEQNQKQTGNGKAKGGAKPKKKNGTQLPNPMDMAGLDGLGLGSLGQLPRDHNRGNDRDDDYDNYQNDHQNYQQNQNHSQKQNQHQNQNQYHNQNFNHHDQGFGQQQDFFVQQQQHQQQQPPPLPAGAIPVPPPMFQPFQMDPRQSAQDINPFLPHANVPMPANFDSPLMHGSEWAHPQHHQRHLTSSMHARSGSHERPKSARRATTTGESHQIKQLKRELQENRGEIQELASMLQNQRLDLRDDSSDSMRDGDSVWSHGHSPTRSLTPPSSPRSHYSEMRQRQSLERRKSHNTRPRYRSERFRDMEIEPAYTYHRDQRPKQLLQRAQTYDDYPSGRAAEPRFVPAPDPPRRAIRQSAGGFDDDYDFRNRERDRDYERRDRDFMPGFGRRQSTYDVDYGQYRQRGGRSGYYD